MKSIRMTIPLLLLCIATAAGAATDAQTSFASLKSLTGNWTGKAMNGHPVQVTFRVTAGGSALMSEINAGPEDMISMFHMDGSRLMMTHYCGAGNQPRMVASASADGKVFTFEYLDATNLESPKAGHMNRLVITMVDANHHTEEWNFVQDGKTLTERFDLQRTE